VAEMQIAVRARREAENGRHHYLGLVIAGIAVQRTASLPLAYDPAIHPCGDSVTI
jgi:hypothetical protein